MARTLLMSPERVRRTLVRLAYEIIERNRGGERLEIFGIRRRGVALAEVIAQTIEGLEGQRLPVYPLDVTPFRDDLASPPDIELLDPYPDVQGRSVVIVDDVLFTGRTSRAALDGVMHYGRPATVQLAVLIDRGHREVPIQPDFIGRAIPTKHQERVTVEVGDGIAVYLEE